MDPYNNPKEPIDYAYLYIPLDFMRYLQPEGAIIIGNLMVDEVREDVELPFFFDRWGRSKVKTRFVECPMEVNYERINSDIDFLMSYGIPHIIEVTYTEDYSQFYVGMLNESMGLKRGVVSSNDLMSRGKIYNEVKSLKPDAHFIDNYTKLRLSHLALNTNLTVEDSLNGYRTYKDSTSGSN